MNLHRLHRFHFITFIDTTLGVPANSGKLVSNGLKRRCFRSITWAYLFELGLTNSTINEFRIVLGNEQVALEILLTEIVEPPSWTSVLSGHGCPHRHACLFPEFRGPGQCFLSQDFCPDVRLDVHMIPLYPIATQ